MQEKLAEDLGLDNLPNYWDKRYIKNLDKLSKPRYEVQEIRDVWLTLRDGTRLCCDVFLPEELEHSPTLVSWSAYTKTMQSIKRGSIPPDSLLFDHSLEA